MGDNYHSGLSGDHFTEVRPVFLQQNAVSDHSTFLMALQFGNHPVNGFRISVYEISTQTADKEGPTCKSDRLKKISTRSVKPVHFISWSLKRLTVFEATTCRVKNQPHPKY